MNEDAGQSNIYDVTINVSLRRWVLDGREIAVERVFETKAPGRQPT